MKNSDNDKIENYLRNKMSPEERRSFEAALDADPELRRQTDEMRQFAENIRQIARADIRRRVEAVRDSIKQEEAATVGLPPKSFRQWLMVAILIFIGAGILGLTAWYLFSEKFKVNTPNTPVAIQETEDPDLEAEMGHVAEPYAAEEVALLDASGQLTGRKIWVEHYPGDQENFFLYHNDTLELYLLSEEQVERPTVLIERNNEIFLKLSNGNEVLLKPTSEREPF